MYSSLQSRDSCLYLIDEDTRFNILNNLSKIKKLVASFRAQFLGRKKSKEGSKDTRDNNRAETVNSVLSGEMKQWKRDKYKFLNTPEY